MPMIAEIKQIDGEMWVKVEPMNFSCEGGHGSITLLNETEIKQLKLSVMKDVRHDLDMKIDVLMKEIY